LCVLQLTFGHRAIVVSVTVHWVNANLTRESAALACRRFKGTYDRIGELLSDVHATFGIADKVTVTVTDNGSNFVKAFDEFGVKFPDDNTDPDMFAFADVNSVL